MIVQVVRALSKERHQQGAAFTPNALKNGTKRPRECQARPGLINQFSTMAKESRELRPARALRGWKMAWARRQTEICKPLQVCAGVHQI